MLVGPGMLLKLSSDNPFKAWWLSDPETSNVEHVDSMTACLVILGVGLNCCPHTEENSIKGPAI